MTGKEKEIVDVELPILAAAVRPQRTGILEPAGPRKMLALVSDLQPGPMSGECPHVRDLRDGIVRELAGAAVGAGSTRNRCGRSPRSAAATARAWYSPLFVRVQRKATMTSAFDPFGLRLWSRFENRSDFIAVRSLTHAPRPATPDDGLSAPSRTGRVE
jgi:hypothetical protein